MDVAVDSVENGTRGGGMFTMGRINIMINEPHAAVERMQSMRRKGPTDKEHHYK